MDSAEDPSDKLEEELRDDVQAMFEEYDEDKSGRLERTEVARMMQRMGQNPSPADIQKYMMVGDKNGDNTLDFEEFWQIFRRHPTPAETENELQESLASIAKSGFVSREDLKSIILADPDNAEEEVDQVLQQFDTNGDGQLDIKEFTKFMQHPCVLD